LFTLEFEFECESELKEQISLLLITHANYNFETVTKNSHCAPLLKLIFFAIQQKPQYFSFLHQFYSSLGTPLGFSRAVE
jgi:hypothetical protein